MNDTKIRNFNDNVQFLYEEVQKSGDHISYNFLKHELVQMELLGVMSKHNAFKQLGGLQMQGGTALRLLHGSPRLSGDIDLCFEPGSNPDEYQMRDAEYLLELLNDEFTARYGMPVTLNKAKAKHLQKPDDDIFVDVYTFAIDTSPNDRSAKKTKLKLEIAGIVAATKEARTVQGNWSILPTSYQNMLVPVETLSEILADKIKSFPSAWDWNERQKFERGIPGTIDPNFRSRDIWDISFILSKGIEVDNSVLELVEKKISDYGIENEFGEKLRSMIDQIDKISDLKVPANLQTTLSANTVEERILNNNYKSLVEETKGVLIKTSEYLSDKGYNFQ